MRTYTITTGVIFALLAIAHVWRIVGERRDLASQPEFLIITLAAAALSAWAFLALRRAPRP
jgi:hypothetical protein